VTLKGGTNGDPKQSVTKFIGEAQFWLGIVTTIVGLSIIGWGIWYSKKAAKELVDGAPKMVKEGVNKEEAEEIKTKLEAVGAKVTLK